MTSFDPTSLSTLSTAAVVGGVDVRPTSHGTVAVDLRHPDGTLAGSLELPPDGALGLAGELFAACWALSAADATRVAVNTLSPLVDAEAPRLPA